MTADTFITQLKTVFNDTDIADATMEDLTDAVIDELNLQGDLSIANMTGTTAGSKTMPTLTSAQKAAIRRVFRVVYASWHKNADNTISTSVGGVNSSVSDLLTNPAVLGMIKQTALLLKRQGSDPPIYVANDPIE